MKLMVKLAVVLTTMLAISVVTFAEWNYNHTKTLYAGSTSIQLCVGYSGNVGYAEVNASDCVYASVSGWARNINNAEEDKSYIVGSFDDDTYRQFRATYSDSVNAVECDFTVVSDDGRCERTVGIELNSKYDW